MMEENQMNVPEGWELNKLGSVCKIKKGVQFNKIELSDSGMYPCVNGGIEPSGYSDLWNTEAETITISEGGNSCGYVNFLTRRFWSGGHCYSLLELKKDLDNDFLFQALKGRESLIMDLRVGSGLPNIQQKAIKEFEFIRPQSPTEQRQIAAILSKVDEAIRHTEALIAKYSRIKTGLMQDLLTKGIDEHGNIRSEETHEFKDSVLGRIPVEWVSCSLGDAITLQRGFDITAKESMEGQVPIYSSSGLTGYHNQASVKGPGVVTGRKGTIGKVFFIASNFWAHDTTLWVKNFKDNDPFFISMILEKLELKRFDNSTANPTLNRNFIHPLPIVLPSDIEEQKAINVIRNNIDKTVSKFTDGLSKLHSIKTGLMQDLLSGKVRLNHLIKETASI